MLAKKSLFSKIQYASDLHLEFPSNKEYLKKNPLQPVGDILILGGDIVPFVVMGKHQDFFSYLADNFEQTYWIPGNHEYYRFDVAEKSAVLNEKIRSNVSLVNNMSATHKNAKLIFSTLWSKISQANQWHIEKNMNDFYLIKHKGFRLTAEKYNQLFEDNLAYIRKELTKANEGKLAIFTHHCPTFLNYPERYKGSELNEAFAVELYDIIETSKIDYWVYGHHHTNTPEFKIGNTRLLTNQLGYVQRNEHLLFETASYFEL